MSYDYYDPDPGDPCPVCGTRLRLEPPPAPDHVQSDEELKRWVEANPPTFVCHHCGWSEDG